MKELTPYYIKYKRIIIPGTMILLSLFLIFAIIIPQISIISESSRAIREADEKANVLSSSISVVQSSNPGQTADNLLTVTTALPTSKDIALIFNALTNTANKTGVSLDEFSLQVGGIYGRAEKVDNGGVTSVPSVSVKVKTTGSAQSTVAFARGLQEALPLSEIKLVDMSDDQATYDVNFFYKPIDLNVLKQDSVAPLSQSDKNLINQLNTWNTQ